MPTAESRPRGKFRGIGYDSGMSEPPSENPPPEQPGHEFGFVYMTCGVPPPPRDVRVAFIPLPEKLIMELARKMSRKLAEPLEVPERIEQELAEAARQGKQGRRAGQGRTVDGLQASDFRKNLNRLQALKPEA